MRLSQINLRNKFSKVIQAPNIKLLEEKNNQSNKKIILLNDSEDLFKQDKESNKEQQSNKSTNQKVEEDEIEYVDEETGGEVSDSSGKVIKIPRKRRESLENQGMIQDEKVNLVEYDIFYEEQFFKDELFKYDAENLKDKEYEKIQNEINKLEIKTKLKEKKKLKEVNEIKGINTDQLKKEIELLDEKYKSLKKETQKKIELKVETNEQFAFRGKMLNLYFKSKKWQNFPKFSIESEE